MSIATKQGDDGDTRLIFGERVSKAHLRVEAYGTIDELNSFLGLARAHCPHPETAAVLERVQRESFIVAAELATPSNRLEKLRQRVEPSMTAALDEHVVEIEAIPGLLDDWALPGATPFGAFLDVARTVTRRAERHAVRLREAGELPNEEILRYLNRLSDVLWLLGRRFELQLNVDGALRSGN